MVYAEDLIKRTSAAVRIQQNWRKYLIHKKQSDSIYAKMKATRAVFRIQRFWRDQVFYHRLSFFSFHTFLPLSFSLSFIPPFSLFLISVLYDLQNILLDF